MTQLAKLDIFTVIVSFWSLLSTMMCFVYFQADSIIHYQDHLAGLIGARPSGRQFAFTDPRLAYALYYGPPFSCHYRLVGPNRWPGARQMALRAYDEYTHQLGATPLSDLLTGNASALLAAAILVAAISGTAVTKLAGWA